MSIETIRLSGTSVRTSAIGMGTTGLLALDGDKKRQEILERAFELGVRHYDTAPYYGYGEAERALGRFIRLRRDQVTITTKFGIQAPRIAGLSTMAALARRMTRRVAPLRKLLSTQAGKLVQRGEFSVVAARKSLAASLSALGTDYIDVYLLHEAGPAETASEELLHFLHENVRKGVIRCFGIGSEFDRVLGVITQHPRYAQVVQFENDVLRRNLEHLPAEENRAVITHRALGDTFHDVHAYLRANPGLLARWSAEIGVDCADAAVLAGLMLTYAARANRSGIVLFSTRSRAHLEANVRVLAERQFADDQVSAFVELVNARPLQPAAT